MADPGERADLVAARSHRSVARRRRAFLEMADAPTLMVTGGAGFIGSAVIRHMVPLGYRVINVDKLTYSGSLASLRDVPESAHYRFVQADICDAERIAALLAEE